jgi:DUF1009 family protein
MQESRPVALLAGSGELPLEFLKSAKRKGREVITFALKGITSPEVEELSARTVWIEPFKLGKFLKELSRSSAREIAFLGKLEHRNALSLKGLDLKAITFLMGLKDRKPESIIKGIFKEVESLGVKVIDPTPYLSHLLLPKGTVLGKRPSEALLQELTEGMEVAKKIASLDVGQTVVLKEGSVVAVEAVEGTDACIKRGASLAGEGFVVCKAARREQDMRVDVPTVGIETVKLIHSLGGKALAIEGEKTYLLNRSEVENFCRSRDFLLISF